MMQFSSFERELLRFLFENKEWADLFDMHIRYRLSPGQVAYAVRNFSELRLLESDGILVRLTNYGRKWIFLNRQDIFLQSGARNWIPSRSEETKASAMLPYMPDLKSVAIDFFLQR